MVTIALDPGTYDLTSALPSVGSATNLGVVIDGSGAASTTIRQTNGADAVLATALNQPLNLTLENVTISGGASSGLSSGAAGSSTTLSNCVSGCAFTNNRATGAAQGQGGGIYFFVQPSGSGSVGHLSISNSTFANNEADFTGADGAGGGVDVAGNGITGNTFNITSNAFTGNLAPNGYGGAIANSGGTLTVEFNRIAGNSAASGDSGLHEATGTGGSATATDDWWGCNAGPGAAACDSAGGKAGGVTFSPWLVLAIGASPTRIPVRGMATLTADLTKDSNGAPTSNAGHLPDGTIVRFAATLGTVSAAATGTIGGKASATFTAGTIAGTGSASATLDQQSTSISILVRHVIDLPDVAMRSQG